MLFIIKHTSDNSTIDFNTAADSIESLRKILSSQVYNHKLETIQVYVKHNFLQESIGQLRLHWLKKAFCANPAPTALEEKNDGLVFTFTAKVEHICLVVEYILNICQLSIERDVYIPMKSCHPGIGALFQVFDKLPSAATKTIKLNNILTPELLISTGNIFTYSLGRMNLLDFLLLVNKCLFELGIDARFQLNKNEINFIGNEQELERKFIESGKASQWLDVKKSCMNTTYKIFRQLMTTHTIEIEQLQYFVEMPTKSRARCTAYEFVNLLTVEMIYGGKITMTPSPFAIVSLSAQLQAEPLRIHNQESKERIEFERQMQFNSVVKQRKILPISNPYENMFPPTVAYFRDLINMFKPAT